MSGAVILPGATIGILGGGQLGRMTALAAARLGYKCHIYTPESDSPAEQVSALTTVAAWDDWQALGDFAAQVAVITLEFENVPLATMAFLEQRRAVHPSSTVLATAQDRLLEKAFFGTFSTTAPWQAVYCADDLQRAIAVVGTPAILKTARFGYDGKGQRRVSAEDDAATLWATLDTEAAILEGFVDFTSEISVIVARDADGNTAVYPPVANVHRHHILHTTTAPAPVNEAVTREALGIALTAAERLGVIGLLAVEMFVTGTGQIVVNEMAPRPHNSGHWTMDAADTDQFEQLVRAVVGLPLGSARQYRPVVMTNLMGDDFIEPDGGLDFLALLANPMIRLHLYGKAQPRPGRKMGHINTLTGKIGRNHG